ncbi:MAG: hypothetical protein KDB86_14170, partial [Actinobacteria bacterium]|nr:hypothetical protein [Actinomycetota bacterium]
MRSGVGIASVDVVSLAFRMGTASSDLEQANRAAGARWVVLNVGVRIGDPARHSQGRDFVTTRT